MAGGGTKACCAAYAQAHRPAVEDGVTDGEKPARVPGNGGVNVAPETGARSDELGGGARRTGEALNANMVGATASVGNVEVGEEDTPARNQGTKQQHTTNTQKKHHAIS